MSSPNDEAVVSMSYGVLGELLERAEKQHVSLSQLVAGMVYIRLFNEAQGKKYPR